MSICCRLMVRHACLMPPPATALSVLCVLSSAKLVHVGLVTGTSVYVNYYYATFCFIYLSGITRGWLGRISREKLLRQVVQATWLDALRHQGCQIFLN